MTDSDETPMVAYPLPKQTAPVRACECWRNKRNEPLTWLLAHDQVKVFVRDGSTFRGAFDGLYHFGDPLDAQLWLDCDDATSPMLPWANVLDVSGELRSEADSYIHTSVIGFLKALVGYLASPAWEVPGSKDFRLLIGYHEVVDIELSRTVQGCVRPASQSGSAGAAYGLTDE